MACSLPVASVCSQVSIFGSPRGVSCVHALHTLSRSLECPCRRAQWQTSTRPWRRRIGVITPGRPPELERGRPPFSAVPCLRAGPRAPAASTSPGMAGSLKGKAPVPFMSPRIPAAHAAPARGGHSGTPRRMTASVSLHSADKGTYLGLYCGADLDSQHLAAFLPPGGRVGPV